MKKKYNLCTIISSVAKEAKEAYCKIKPIIENSEKIIVEIDEFRTADYEFMQQLQLVYHLENNDFMIDYNQERMKEMDY